MAPQSPLAKAKRLSLAQIAAEPFIAYDRADYPEYHALLEKIFAAAGQRPNIIEEHDGVNGIILSVESGSGCAFLPDSVSCLTGARIKLIPLADAPAPLSVVAAWKEKNLSAPAKEFIDTVITKSMTLG